MENVLCLFLQRRRVDSGKRILSKYNFFAMHQSFSL